MSEEVQSGSSSLFYSLPRGRPYRTRQHLQKPCALPFRSPSEAFIPKCEQFLKLLSHEPQLFHLFIDLLQLRRCQGTNLLAGEPPLSRTRRIRTNSARLNPTDSARRTSCTRLTASVGYSRYPASVRLGRASTPMRS